MNFQVTESVKKLSDSRINSIEPEAESMEVSFSQAM